MELLNTLRQLSYPPEFRIAPPVLSDDFTAVLEQLTRALEEEVKAPTPAPANAAAEKTQRRLLADVGTGLWRLRQKLLQPGTNRPYEETRKAYRHFEAVWDALKQAGMEIRDHLGEPYIAGSGLDVAAFEPRPGLNREMIVDAVKPTILLNGQLLQVGQVIVGTPEKQD
jgi:hypothetical protein